MPSQTLKYSAEFCCVALQDAVAILLADARTKWLLLSAYMVRKMKTTGNATAVDFRVFFKF